MFNINTGNINQIDKLSLNILSEITAKLNSGEFKEADEQIITVSTEYNMWDIRLIMYYLFSQISQKNIASSVNSLENICSILTEHYDCLSPTKQKEKILKKTIEWLDKYLPSKLALLIEQDFDIKQKEACLEHIKNLSSVFTKFEGVTPELNKKTASLLSQVSNNTTVKEECEEEIDTSISDTQNEIDSETNIQPKKNMDAISTSFEWQHLCDLLNEYKQYISSDQSEIAYIIYLKIEEKLQNFDPIQYFPGVFKEYMESKMKHYPKLLSFHSQKLEEQPYSKLINQIIETKDHNLRKAIYQEPFKYSEKE